MSTFSFEKSLASLKTLVSDMESGKLTLEDSLKAFEKGVKLVDGCQHYLKDIQQKVSVLTEKNEAFLLEDFEADDDE